MNDFNKTIAIVILLMFYSLFTVCSWHVNILYPILAAPSVELDFEMNALTASYTVQKRCSSLYTVHLSEWYAIMVHRQKSSLYYFVHCLLFRRVLIIQKGMLVW